MSMMLAASGVVRRPDAVSATSGASRNVTAHPVIIELTGAANVPDEEVFGPLLGVWRYDSFDDAIRMANNTRFGLSCGLVSPIAASLINCCSRRGQDRQLE